MLKIYLIGCLVEFVLSLFRYGYIMCVLWWSGETTKRKNLEKIETPHLVHDKSDKIFFVVLSYIPVLSWLDVFSDLIIIFTFYKNLLSSRSSAPANVRAILYPLETNNNLSIEMVWALKVALSKLSGNDDINYSYISEWLSDMKHAFPHFNINKAINNLKGLNVVDNKNDLGGMQEHFNT